MVMTRRRLLPGLVLALAAASPAHADGLRVQVLSRVVGHAGAPDAREKRVRLGTAVELFARVEGAGFRLAADGPTDCAGLATRHPEAGKGCEIRWFKVEPVDHSLSNTDPTFHWHEIRYQDTPIPACDDRLRCLADVRTTVLGDRGGLGTMAFRVRVALGGRVGASVGSERRHRGGLVPELPRVTVRRDDTYLGWLTELFNTPYIWGSAGDDRVHQAERRIGSDCADFVTYGIRRLGHEIPYTSSFQLGTFLRPLHRSSGAGSDGLFRDPAGEPIPIGPGGVRPGDVLRFPGHVGAFVRDEPPLGVLSDSDVMIHTCWNEPTEEPLRDSDYARQPMEIGRWKVLDR